MRPIYTAQYASRCARCGKAFDVGVSQIVKVGDRRWAHYGGCTGLKKDNLRSAIRKLER